MYKKIKISAMVILLVTTLCYVAGTISQVVRSLSVWMDAGGVNAGLPTMPVLTPGPVLSALFVTPYTFWGLGAVALLGMFILAIFVKNNAVQGTLDKDRNLVYSSRGAYGTAGWMTKEELKKELELTKDLYNCRGNILGELNGKVVCVPENTMMNRNVAVYGAAGSMKSRAYVRNMVFQCVRRGESLIITDPKSELYSSMAEYLRDNGYVVKVFNLISPEHSDSWNCLREIEDENPELMAQIFCDVVIRNTLLNGKMDPFWDTGAISLLKALSLYVIQSYPEQDRYFGEVYKLLTMASGEELKATFGTLPFGHSAKAPFDIFSQGSDNVRSGIIIGLANRIQVFQNSQICNITRHNEIDLSLPGKKRCAYFCITSDQDSTFDFLSSLFLSFLFIKLIRFADSQPNQQLPVPVHLLGDELPNIGVIPDLTKKISTCRSRLLSISVIFQNIAQMKNRYPNDAWLEIIGNCDTQLFLGCTDEISARFISDRTGTITVGVESQMKELSTMRVTNYAPSFRSSSSVGKRMLLTPDEVLRFPRDEALVIFRGQNVLRVKKFDYTRHPESRKLRECSARDHIPDWCRQDMVNEPVSFAPHEGYQAKPTTQHVSAPTHAQDGTNRSAARTPRRYPLPKAQPLTRPQEPILPMSVNMPASLPLSPDNPNSDMPSTSETHPGSGHDVIALDDLLADL